MAKLECGNPVPGLSEQKAQSQGLNYLSTPAADKLRYG